ncbi:MAG: hypothetical protein AAF637_00020 [Pseudomonadota bacterium]
MRYLVIASTAVLGLSLVEALTAEPAFIEPDSVACQLEAPGRHPRALVAERQQDALFPIQVPTSDTTEQHAPRRLAVPCDPIAG